MKLKIFTDHKHQWRQITPNSKSNGKDNLQWKSNLCFSIKAISSFFHFKSKCWNISILVFPKSHINIHHCHIFLYIGCGPRQMEDLRHSVEGVSKYRILSQPASNVNKRQVEIWGSKKIKYKTWSCLTMFYVIYPEFWKFLGKSLIIWIFFLIEIFLDLNFFLEITSYNFQSRSQMMTLEKTHDTISQNLGASPI